MRPIPGFPRYRIGPQGLMYSGTRGEWIHMRTGLTKDGYVSLMLTDINGRQVRKLVHRLVAITYLGAPEQGMQVNHKNGNKRDNRLSNLEWCSASYNVQHAFDTRLKLAKRGEQSHLSILTENQVREIRASELTGSQLAKLYNISQGAISLIRNRKTWKDVI